MARIAEPGPLEGAPGDGARLVRNRRKLESVESLEHAFMLVDAESEEDEEDASEEASEQGIKCLKACVTSKIFDLTLSLIIVLNIICMAFEADNPYLTWPAGCDVDKTPGCIGVWNTLNMAFLGIFVLEIVLRIAAFGCEEFFCTNDDSSWNIFDFMIVLLGTLDLTARMLRLGRRGGRFIILARVLRILRVLRIARLLKTFRQLRMLARGLVESVTVVFWIFFLIIFLTFLYAIFFTDIINHSGDMWGEDTEKIKEYFGTVCLSMFTLFQFVTLDNWTDVDALLMEHMPRCFQLVIFSFIIIAAFVILSLLTGVMADHMDQVRKDEEADTIRQNRKNVEQTKATFNRLFAKDGRRSTAYVTKKEFWRIFADRGLAAQLNADDVELTGPEAAELFEIFDKDCDGVIMWPEFLSGLEDFREGLTALQLLELKSILKRLEREVQRSQGQHLPGEDYRKALPSEEAQMELAKTEARIFELDKRLSRFDSKVKDMMKIYKAETYAMKSSVKRKSNTRSNVGSPTKSSPSQRDVTAASAVSATSYRN